MEIEAHSLKISTIFRFLFGSRQAICDIARCKSGLLIGFLLTLSAGFAREYDAEYLVAEPWHVLISAGASLAASFILFTLLFVIAKRRGAMGIGFFQTYCSFLALFWMTAPLAWVYAIPVERFLDPLDSVIANMWFLKIVSFWRVVLMIRIVVVFFGGSIAASTFAVMLFADMTMQIALEFMPFPVLNFMGGIHLSDRAAVINETAVVVMYLGILTMPIWLIGTLVVLICKLPAWKCVELSPRTNASASIWRTSVASVLVWLAVLPLTQPGQHLRYQTEALLTSDRIGDGLRLMSKHQLDDYPPLWEPPPRPDFREYDPDLHDVMLAMDKTEVASWVDETYSGRFRQYIGIGKAPRAAWRWRRSQEEIGRTVSILEQLSDGPEYAAEILTSMEQYLESWDDDLVVRIKKLAE